MREPAKEASTVFDTISVRTGSQIAKIITNVLDSIDHGIQGIFDLRCYVVYPFSHEGCSWILLNWKIKDCSQHRVAIFDATDPEQPEPGRCNWLMLSRPPTDKSDRLGSDKDHMVKKSQMAWNVTSLLALRDLFYAARHALGVLTMPREDARSLYCGTKSETCSPEEYCPPEMGDLLTHIRWERHARLLFQHFIQLEYVCLTFDRVSPQLHQISERSGNCCLFGTYICSFGIDVDSTLCGIGCSELVVPCIWPGNESETCKRC